MAFRGQDYEFVLYGLVVVLIGLWVVLKQRSVGLPLRDLWGLAIWGLPSGATRCLLPGDLRDAPNWTERIPSAASKQATACEAWTCVQDR